MSWQAAMLRPNNKVSQYDAVPFSSPHYSNYYVQEEADDGVVMESTVPAKDVRFSPFFSPSPHNVLVHLLLSTLYQSRSSLSVLLI